MPTDRHIAEAQIRPGITAEFSLRRYHGREFAVVAELAGDGSIRKRLLIRTDKLDGVITALETVRHVAFKINGNDELTRRWREKIKAD